MGLLPEIEDGQIVPRDKREAFELYTPPKKIYPLTVKEEERLTELNNFRRKPLTEDFSDSPHLDI